MCYPGPAITSLRQAAWHHCMLMAQEAPTTLPQLQPHRQATPLVLLRGRSQAPAVAALCTCRFSSNHHICGASMESTKRHPWAISPGRCAASFASQRLSACRRDNVLFSRACSPTRASFTSSIHQFTRMVSGWTHGRVDVVPSPPVCRQAGCSRLLPRHALWTYMCAIVVVLSAWAPASAIGAYDCASGGWLCDAKLTVIGTCRVRFSAVAVGSTRHPVRHAINNALRA